MRKLYIGIIVLVLVAIGLLYYVLLGNGVYFDEMNSGPEVKVYQNKIIIETTNSIKNSAQKIYKMEMKAEFQKLVVRAKQSAIMETKKKHEFLLSDYNVYSLQGYSLYWEDPDSKQHLIVKW